jgi:hypothetical protein
VTTRSIVVGGSIPADRRIAVRYRERVRLHAGDSLTLDVVLPDGTIVNVPEATRAGVQATPGDGFVDMGPLDVTGAVGGAASFKLSDAREFCSRSCRSRCSGGNTRGPAGTTAAASASASAPVPGSTFARSFGQGLTLWTAAPPVFPEPEPESVFPFPGYRPLEEKRAESPQRTMLDDFLGVDDNDLRELHRLDSFRRSDRKQFLSKVHVCDELGES